MYFIVPFIFLMVIVWVILLLVGGSLAIATRKPKQNSSQRPSEAVTEPNHVGGDKGHAEKD